MISMKELNRFSARAPKREKAARDPNSNEISSAYYTENPLCLQFHILSHLPSTPALRFQSSNQAVLSPQPRFNSPPETWRSFWVPPSTVPLPIGGQRVLVKTHQASPTAFMGFLPLFLGMYSSSGERDSGSSLHSGELWLCSARVLFWEALLAVAPERIPVDRKEGQ